MTRAQANILRAFSLWTVFVWGTRIKNVFDADRGWGFIIVHVILALISVAFAVATWTIVTRNRGSNAPPLAQPGQTGSGDDDKN